MSASRSNRWIIAAATWKTTNAPIHVKNKRSAKARNTNLIEMTLLGRDDSTLEFGESDARSSKVLDYQKQNRTGLIRNGRHFKQNLNLLD
jgi:hypothetical protein